MLSPRGPEEAVRRPDPLASIVVFGLALIAVGLFVAAILAVYTYSTPAAELPLIVAIALAFVTLFATLLLGLALRRFRAGRLR